MTPQAPISNPPQAYLDILLPLIDRDRGFLEAGETLAPMAFVGALERRHGVWVAQMPIKHKGVSKKKRTIGAAEFRWYDETAGRFSGLLPVKEEGGGVLH